MFALTLDGVHEQFRMNEYMNVQYVYNSGCINTCLTFLTSHNEEKQDPIKPTWHKTALWL